MFIARTRVPWALPRFHVPLPEAPRQAPPQTRGSRKVHQQTLLLKKGSGGFPAHGGAPGSTG